MIYLELLLGFLKIGCFSFGGAYAAIPLIRETVQSYGWIDDEKLSTMIAVSESTPGPIMVNMATCIGNEQGGFPGALIATCAVVLPAFLVVILIMTLFKALIKKPAVQAALDAMKYCVTGVILATGAYMAVTRCVGTPGALRFDLAATIFTVVLGGLYFGMRYGRINQKIQKKVTPIALILTAAIGGIFVWGL